MTDLTKAAPMGLNGLTASEASAKLEAGTITSEALVQDCLDRIEAREPDVRAWAWLDPDHALEQARACDAERRRSVLHGIPIGIKDIFDTEDMPTGHGFPPYKDKSWGAESACVAALRAAGMVIMGKTVTTEFACPKPIGTRNPHDFERTASVSSSGSGAAVADYMVTLANGTQTGGSVIGPAASNGVYGFKASLDGIDRSGLRHCKPGIDTIGLFARSIDDLVLLRSVNTGTAAAPALDNGAQPRIGIVRTAAWEQTEPCARTAIRSAANLLEGAGAEIKDVELPDLFTDIIDDFAVVNAWEGSHALANEVRDHLGDFNDHNRDRVEFAKGLTEEQYNASVVTLTSARAKMDALVGEYDLFLTPSLPGEAPVGLTEVRTAIFNRLWTQMYMPAVNLPLFEGPNDMPVNIQLVGRQNRDAETLAAAKWADDRLRELLGPIPVKV